MVRRGKVFYSAFVEAKAFKKLAVIFFNYKKVLLTLQIEGEKNGRFRRAYQSFGNKAGHESR